MWVELAGKGGLVFIPFWWGNTTEQALHNRLKELFLELSTESQA